jgi:hypothetical protein
MAHKNNRDNGLKLKSRAKCPKYAIYRVPHKVSGLGANKKLL